ncbi:hypothetical protein DL89DRAFT_91499 [Linderina pennispora]|uniref:Uncharacterized protein n=1 Tax=Linderina pennispora TaxID=61395 RepID=A0A1Y1WIM7_9FUNG|nr:uncharacterized protein DL89DRAFT_91499 [Linderina pennispora]ORX73332.1 hypothetical protein DL89DRAFT_91499 [Linderina pennispora]
MPGYDPISLANNVAIIQYNISTSFSWDFTLGVNVTEYTDVYFVRRSLKNLTAMEWYPNDVVSVKASDSQCSSWSNVFSENKGDWMCNNKTTESIFTSKCNVPYGTVYGIMGKTYTLAGVYSHTVVRGDNVCSDSKQLQYYTMFANYFNWAKSVLGYSIRRGTKNKDKSTTVPADFSMRRPDSITISGYSAIGGDLYFLQGVKNHSVPVMADESSTKADPGDESFLSADTGIEYGSALEPVEGDTFVSGSEPVAPSESKSISRGEIIAIAVCVPAGLIIIFLAVFFGLKWRKRRQASRSWDPQLETENLRTVALDIPGATSVDAEAPPRYESMHERNSALAFASAISEVTKSP